MKRIALLVLVALLITACADKKPDNSYQRQHQQSEKAHKELGGHSSW